MVVVVSQVFDWTWSILFEIWTMSACNLAFSLCRDMNMSFMLCITGAICEDISSRVACCRAVNMSGSRGVLLTFVLNVDGEVSRDAFWGG